ncbi:unnamed protein product [Diamesa hyperborea]
MFFINVLYNICILIHIQCITMTFDVFWNIPSFMCRKHETEFTKLNAYGIQQNFNDEFRGEKVSIMYDPGMFPAILKQKGQRDFHRNGGVPQEGSIEQHLVQYKKHVDEQIPDINNSGLIIIDFESWRPIFRQNFGALKPYKDLSIRIEQQNHPFWLKNINEAQAAKRFEKAGREFVEKTILLSKHLRPNAKWGYYAFPYCFNKGTIDCSKKTKDENDRMRYIFKAADMILPSVYLHEKDTADEKSILVEGRIKESVRVSESVSKRLIYVYIRHVYSETRNLLTEKDMRMVFETAKAMGANGIILWGSSSDLTTKDKCMEFKTHLDTVLGPISKEFIS